MNLPPDSIFQNTLIVSHNTLLQYNDDPLIVESLTWIFDIRNQNKINRNKMLSTCTSKSNIRKTIVIQVRFSRLHNFLWLESFAYAFFFSFFFYHHHHLLIIFNLDLFGNKEESRLGRVQGWGGWKKRNEGKGRQGGGGGMTREEEAKRRKKRRRLKEVRGGHMFTYMKGEEMGSKRGRGWHLGPSSSSVPLKREDSMQAKMSSLVRLKRRLKYVSHLFFGQWCHFTYNM